MDMKHYKITVRGRVQGVWFRRYTAEKAVSLQIKGFVRNLDNGDVYVEAEGENVPMNIFTDWLYTGSPNSKVYDVVLEEGDLKHFRTFEINR
jgi:acylphosphatase